MKKFEPMKAYNKKEDLSKIKFPKLVSFKLDGLRCLFVKGEMLSRSLKPIVNKQIREKLERLGEFSKKHNIILDGEIYSHGVPFPIISSCVMTQDYSAKKSKLAWEELCDKHHFSMSREEVLKGLKFYAFDCVNQEKFEESFIDRINTLQKLNEFNEILVVVKQDKIKSFNDVESYFEHALKNGYEGLMLKAFDSPYKCGRTTYREDTMHKVKPFVTFDAKIIGIVQSTKVDPKAEKKINELGRSVTSKKKEDRIPIQKASAFIVMYNGNECKPVLKMTDEEKEEVWNNKESYIGKTIEYKGMLIGSKDVPRHPVMIRFREDK